MPHAAARDVYFWAWTAVNVYNRRVGFEKLPGPGKLGGALPAAPPNQLVMLMAANQIQAAPEKGAWWYKQGPRGTAQAPAATQVNDVAAAEDPGCIVTLASELEIDGCAVALGRDAIATPTLADARGQIESCLMRKGYTLSPMPVAPKP